MWKILVAFVAFAAVGIFVIMKGGNSLDMGGEKHGADTHVPEPAPAAPAASAPASPAVPAPAAAAPVAK